MVAFRLLYQPGEAWFGLIFYGWYDVLAASLVTHFYMATQVFYNARDAKRAIPSSSLRVRPGPRSARCSRPSSRPAAGRPKTCSSWRAARSSCWRRARARVVPRGARATFGIRAYGRPRSRAQRPEAHGCPPAGAAYRGHRSPDHRRQAVHRLPVQHPHARGLHRSGRDRGLPRLRGRPHTVAAYRRPPRAASGAATVGGGGRRHHLPTRRHPRDRSARRRRLAVGRGARRRRRGPDERRRRSAIPPSGWGARSSTCRSPRTSSSRRSRTSMSRWRRASGRCSRAYSSRSVHRARGRIDHRPAHHHRVRRGGSGRHPSARFSQGAQVLRDEPGESFEGRFASLREPSCRWPTWAPSLSRATR